MSPMALNPVTAKLVTQAQDWRWSSARAHLAEQDDGIVTTRPLLERIDNFAEFLANDNDKTATAAVRQALSIGRPLMDDERLRRLEQELGRAILPRKRGPKPAEDPQPDQGELSIG